MTRLILVAGATGVIVLWSWPAEAERRDESYQFCQGAPDLCVFVCTPECPGMSDDYVCESRRGRLVVLEGGERSYCEEGFSLCWHRSRPADDPPPDPERDHVPGWPGSEEGAMCMGCETQATWCHRVAREHLDACINDQARYYTTVCDWSMRQHGVPRGRHNKKIDVGTYCAWTLRNMGRDAELESLESSGSTRSSRPGFRRSPL